MHVPARRLPPALAALFLLACLLAAVIESWHWPLVGDATLMHYVVFLIERGWAPYRQIIDINLPGSYFFESVGMHLFGGGAVAWRIYDLLLLAVCCISAFAIVPRRDWFAAVFASALFCLIHIQDGIAQTGQRDLLITAFVACAYAVFLPGRNTRLLSLCAGVLTGATVVIKPLYLPLGLLLASVAAYGLRDHAKRAKKELMFMLAGMTVAPLVALFYLLHCHALGALWQTMTGLIPLHASLGRKPPSYLVAHCLAPVAPLCAIWIVTTALQRPRVTAQRLQLGSAAALSLLGYFAQGKGYPYHRYPLLFFLLLLIGWDLLAAARTSGLARIFAIAGFVLGCFFLAPQAAWKIHIFETATPFQSALARDLTILGGQKLSGNIQCLDTFGGCINTLYDLQLVQSSGFLYDCYMFTTTQNKITADYRKAFWKAYQSNPPGVIVMTSQFCFGPDTFAKLDNWPKLKNDLDRSYKLETEWVPTQPQHWWSRREFPAGFRIYVRINEQHRAAVPGGN